VRHNYYELDKKEQKLRESEENYRRIVETSYDGIWVLDSQFRIMQVNNRMAEILGYQPHEIRGRLITDFIHADDPPDHECQPGVTREGIRDWYEQRYLRKHRICLCSLNEQDLSFSF
jgi:PAS domain S-box-containing protein